MNRLTDLIPRRREARLLHIPKTGGTYVAQHESQRGPVVQPLTSIGHVFIKDRGHEPPQPFPLHGFQRGCVVDRRTLGRHRVLACVRNPFSWLVSYAGHAGGWNPKYRDPDHYDYDHANRGFEYLVKTLADREDTWPSRKPLFIQLFGTDGTLVPHYVARNETLTDDLSTFADRYGFTHRPGPTQRHGGHDDYRSYYTDPLIDLVNATWRRELALFAYGFDGLTDAEPLLPRHVDADARRGFHYDYHRDRLSVDGFVLEPGTGEADARPASPAEHSPRAAA